MNQTHKSDSPDDSQGDSPGDSQNDSQGDTLAFDACSPRMSFCLWRSGRVCLRWASSGGDLAEDLPSLLAAEITERVENFSYGLLRSICFVRGPGSYTGLRASLSVARGFRLACSGLRLYSVTSFEAGLLSLGARERGGRVLSLVESFRGVWYGQAFAAGEALGEARVLGDDALRLWVFELLEAGAEGAEGGAGGLLRICGSGAGRARAEALQNFSEQNFSGRGLLMGEDALGDACGFSRPLVEEGDEALYKRGEEALQPIYMSAPV